VILLLIFHKKHIEKPVPLLYIRGIRKKLIVNLEVGAGYG